MPQKDNARDAQPRMPAFVLRYGGAVLAVAAGIGLRWVLQGIFGHSFAHITYATFYPIVALVAMLAGAGPGMLAAILSAVIADEWIVASADSAGIDAAIRATRSGLFLVASLVICVMGEMLRHARRQEKAVLEKQVAERTSALQQARDELEMRVEESHRYAAELEISNRELDTFAYTASHDLKAPLRAVQHLAQWISEDAGPHLSEESQKHMQLMLRRIERLERLLDDLLDFSRIGRMPHEPVTIDTGRLVAEVVEMLAPPADFTIEVGPLPVLIGQRPPLEQVFRNLIGNAIKYHDRPNGTVHIAAEDRGAMWEFAVRDDGPGIAPEYHERVFEMFQRLQTRARVEGSGMGLALVKKLVENQGGRVRLESIPGQGATFRFTWPKTRER